MEKIVFLDNAFWKEDKDFIELINSKILPRIKWAMDNEEHIPVHFNYKRLPPKDNSYKERCSEDVLVQKIKESKLERKGWTVNNLKRHKVAQYGKVVDTMNWQLANISEKIKNEPSFFSDFFYKYFKRVIVRNKVLWYKPGSYMGWHTNAEGYEAYRFYIVWCDEDNKSFFRVRDPETGEIITRWEKKGWNFNYFKLGNKEKPTWHCLYSDCNRFSVGFRLENE